LVTIAAAPMASAAIAVTNFLMNELLLDLTWEPRWSRRTVFRLAAALQRGVPAGDQHSSQIACRGSWQVRRHGLLPVPSHLTLGML
jgi:hypothetical protein